MFDKRPIPGLKNNGGSFPSASLDFGNLGGSLMPVLLLGVAYFLLTSDKGKTSALEGSTSGGYAIGQAAGQTAGNAAAGAGAAALGVVDGVASVGAEGVAGVINNIIPGANLSAAQVKSAGKHYSNYGVMAPAVVLGQKAADSVLTYLDTQKMVKATEATKQAALTGRAPVSQEYSNKIVADAVAASGKQYILLSGSKASNKSSVPSLVKITGSPMPTVSLPLGQSKYVGLGKAPSIPSPIKQASGQAIKQAVSSGSMKYAPIKVRK